MTRALAAYRKMDLTGPPRERAPRSLTKQVIHLTHAQVAQMVERYEAGATVYELAAEFGCNRKTVAVRLKKAKLGILDGRRRVVRPPQALLDEVSELRAQGLSKREISRRMGFSATTVARYLRLADD